jgi:hypothetical protein
MFVLHQSAIDGCHRLTALHLSLLQHSLTQPPRSFPTMRGQKKKTLTSRALSATGRRKAAKSSDPFADENENPAGPLSPTPSKPRPKPRPIKKAANGANSRHCRRRQWRSYCCACPRYTAEQKPRQLTCHQPPFPCSYGPSQRRKPRPELR